MPVGLYSGTFLCFVNDIFCNLLDSYVIAYLDDILVYLTTWEEHVIHVWDALSHLYCHHLYAKLEKLAFFQQCMDVSRYSMGLEA